MNTKKGVSRPYMLGGLLIMDTKLKSDIAECAVTTHLLRRGFKVLRPIGDRLPYDLAVDIDGSLIRIQVKAAWPRKAVYIVDSRRTKTNRRNMIRSKYLASDFDYAILYIDKLDLCYVMPISQFRKFKSEITLRTGNHQRAALADQYRSRWDLLRGGRLDQPV